MLMLVAHDGGSGVVGHVGAVMLAVQWRDALWMAPVAGGFQGLVQLWRSVLRTGLPL